MPITRSRHIARRRRSPACLFCALAMCLVVASAAAQEQPLSQRTVQVGTYVSPPFVIQGEGSYTGMAIELWETLASNLGLTSDYSEFETLRDLVDATAAGKIDVAVTNLTITRGRAQRIEFTQPWFDAGLRLMVNDDRNVSFGDIVDGLHESGYLRAYAWLAFVIVIGTLCLTVFDRRFDKDFPGRWRDGLAESFHSVMSVATSGRMPGRKNLFGWVGRFMQGFWLVCGIAVFAYITSSVTSVMTTLSLTNRINSIADLPGKTVGVFTGSVAEDFAQDLLLPTRSFANIDNAVTALLDGRIEAIIGDAPVLEYHAHIHPDQTVSVVGARFHPDKYGFGLRPASDLRRPLIVDLLGAHENGLVEELRSGYFGQSP